MQLQAITYFNELVRCRSIRRAAQALGVSPTAISRQLENLEYHFGAPLVERSARGIVLTAAGEQLAIHARTAPPGSARGYVHEKEPTIVRRNHETGRRDQDRNE